MLDCLENIIGLSDCDCPCLEDDRPADYDESKSGLYITDCVNLKMVDAMADCGQGSGWDILAKARASAIRDFTADFTARVMKESSYAYPPSRDFIGQNQIRGAAPNRAYEGIRICFSSIKGGCLIIHGINAVFSQTGTIEVSVWLETDGIFTQVDTRTINTTAGAVEQNVFTTPLELSMYLDNCDQGTYYLVSESAGNVPMLTKLGCGCSHEKHKGARRWAEFSGFYSDTPVDQGRNNKDNMTHGLVLDVETKCKISEIICDKPFDFENNPFSLVMAHAINHLAAAYTYKYIDESDLLNRYTMLTELQADSKIKNHKTEYFDRLDYLEENMMFEGVSCIVCGGAKNSPIKSVIH